MNVDGERLQGAVAELARIGGRGDGRVDRIAYSPEDQQARAWIAARLRARGLTVTRDAAGTTIARLEGTDPSLPPLAIGSHSDTVPAGGAFDGALGVLAAVACVETLLDSGTRLRHPVEVIDFAAEEASVGGGLLGSKAMAGLLDAGVTTLPVAGGGAVADHLRAAGLDPERLADARRADPPRAFLELHIEQGQVLERAGADIGVVERLLGIRGYGARFSGRAAHAGTTPMDDRDDALVSAARFVLAVQRLADDSGVVATVGTLEVHPGAVNVIPGEVRLSVDVRGADDALLDSVEARLQTVAGSLRGTLDARIRTAPVTFSAQLCDTIDAAARRRGLRAERMASGAGHDAMCMASLTEAAMLFVPSRGGISHNPAEYTTPEQCARGAQTLLDTLVALDATARIASIPTARELP